MKQTAKRPFLIAITGGIASGKSLVSQWLEERNYVGISTDKIGHQVLLQAEIKEKLVVKYGESILLNDEINRAVLAKFVFEKTEDLIFLNKLVHPQIRKILEKMVDGSEEEFLFIEVPLLFENGLNECFDLIINISIKKDIQIKRLDVRDGMKEEDALKKITSQFPESVRSERADINIDNNFTLDRLYAQLSKLLQYLNKFEKKDVKRFVEEK